MNGNKLLTSSCNIGIYVQKSLQRVSQQKYQYITAISKFFNTERPRPGDECSFLGPGVKLKQEEKLPGNSKRFYSNSTLLFFSISRILSFHERFDKNKLFGYV